MFGPSKGGHFGVRPPAGSPACVSHPVAGAKAGLTGVWAAGSRTDTMWRLRCKAKDSTHVLQGLSSRTRLRELQGQIAAITGIAPGGQRILVGFPPECLDLSNEETILGDLPIQSGDMLIVEEDQTRPQTSPAFTNHGAPSSVREPLPVLTRTTVPADNSCLFTSVYYVVEGGVLNPACAPEMRRLIAQIVASDPDFYSEAILGKTNQEYCDWIKRDDTWGGAIEISILSKFYQCEICVVDTQTVRIDRFGEDAGYSKRVLLIYDGIHYDPLQRNFPDPDTPPLTIFSSNDDIVLVQALELADEARRKRQFTDVNRFTLRCMVCQKGLTGQEEAREHAKETGHTSFGEV
ncbi:ubiquitin thioesterase OTU1 [Fukomys damarensis]|uniref:Ubiquitin thioesterase OTU n=1 Tax=Fukomys damarensis TaxID=885580 RepID=A0A091CNR1_FUKDA|nr:ubiquitin thioesterase OTU1 [Fukomys damarensis]KFO19652.1 Ubiquitin thioesterase OTU1 [Fukomys damarensis]